MTKKLLVFLMTFITVIAIVTFVGCGTDDSETSAPPEFITGDEISTDTVIGEDVSSDTEETDNEEEADNSKNLVIPLSSLTTSAQFFGINVDGTYMEVIAFKYGNTYRTAFNTCQICYGSRTAYYKQSGSYLVCQNCGSKFALSNVGLKTSSRTCSPYPVLETDRTLDSQYIIISYEFLVKTKNLFKTWKVT